MNRTELRHRFGRWRRARPFWGGLMLVLSAAVLFLSANLTLEAMQVHFGQEGFLSYLLPLMLLLCGLLIWFTPAQRVFYAIIALLTAVYSLIGLNLGGFGVGMLLGIAGGALAIAWTPTKAPVEPPPFAEPGRDEASTVPGSGSGQHRKALAVIAVPLAVSLALVLGGQAPAARAEPSCPEGVSSASPDRSGKPGKSKGGTKETGKTPIKPTGSVAPAEDGDTGNPIVDGWNDFVEGVGDLFGGGDEETPSPSPSTTGPAPKPTGKPTPTPSAKPTKTTEPEPGDDEIPCLGPRVYGKKAGPDALPQAAIIGGLMEGDKLTMYDSTYDGVTTLKTARGPKKVLKFSMRESVTTPFKLTIREPGGHTTRIETGALTTTGNVRFYTPRFEGKLFGVIPVTFTPDRPPPLTLPKLEFTDVRIDLSYVRCDKLTGKPSLEITEIP
ncbi:DUF6114 domain-containing protein [Actinoplanes sp. NBRC 103695]|uniref:DUF6114 domain-containing protein n=1 Tax=Actinoplanes sp. NBRC 103695 TaxID=3032202 RepID=UPI0024A263C1|nr:DUF6114 domain-containing protein [Actinoplanes sp. NBRC 103695]GLY99164.1 hypothetical protein Acsp02_64180 [Actinoplanes sp. NBRC 103695]